MTNGNGEHSFEEVVDELHKGKAGATKAQNTQTNTLKRLLVIPALVLAMGGYMYSANEGFATWFDSIFSKPASTDELAQSAPDQINLDEIEDIDQGFFIELIKAEATEYVGSDGEDNTNIRKTISTVFPADPALWATLEDTILFGDANDPKMFYVFADPSCPACMALEKDLLGYKGEPLSYRVLPISGHGDSVDQIDQIMCAENPKEAWVKALTNEETQTAEISADCEVIGSHVRNRLLFDALGFNSTPSIWMPGNNRVVKDGVPSAADLRRLADAAPL